MKTHSKISLALLFASALLAAPAAWAEPAGEKCPMHERAAESAKKLDTLHTDLKLNAEQEKAWGEWSAKLKADGPDGWKARHKDFEGWANLPAIERMEKKLKFIKEHQAKLEERLAATKAFYATLTDAQRKVFDKQFVFHAHGHRHGGRGSED